MGGLFLYKGKKNEVFPMARIVVTTSNSYGGWDEKFLPLPLALSYSAASYIARLLNYAGRDTKGEFYKVVEDDYELSSVPTITTSLPLTTVLLLWETVDDLLIYFLHVTTAELEKLQRCHNHYLGTGLEEEIEVELMEVYALLSGKWKGCLLPRDNPITLTNTTTVITMGEV